MSNNASDVFSPRMFVEQFVASLKDGARVLFAPVATIARAAERRSNYQLVMLVLIIFAVLTLLVGMAGARFAPVMSAEAANENLIQNFLFIVATKPSALLFTCLRMFIVMSAVALAMNGMMKFESFGAPFLVLGAFVFIAATVLTGVFVLLSLGQADVLVWPQSLSQTALTIICAVAAALLAFLALLSVLALEQGLGFERPKAALVVASSIAIIVAVYFAFGGNDGVFFSKSV